jgi:hypothetical protein
MNSEHIAWDLARLKLDDDGTIWTFSVAFSDLLKPHELACWRRELLSAGHDASVEHNAISPPDLTGFSGELKMKLASPPSNFRDQVEHLLATALSSAQSGEETRQRFLDEVRGDLRVA